MNMNTSTSAEFSVAWIWSDTTRVFGWCVRIITNMWSENLNPISAAGHLSFSSFGQCMNNKALDKSCLLFPASTAVWQGLCSSLFVFSSVCIRGVMFPDGATCQEQCERDVTLLWTFFLWAGWLVSPAERHTAPAGWVIPGCRVFGPVNWWPAGHIRPRSNLHVGLQN